MTSSGPDEGRTTSDLSRWREFAIDGDLCVAQPGPPASTPKGITATAPQFPSCGWIRTADL